VAEAPSARALEHVLGPYLAAPQHQLPPLLLAHAAERLAELSRASPSRWGEGVSDAAASSRLAGALSRAMLAQCPSAAAGPVARLLWALARACDRPVGPEEHEEQGGQQEGWRQQQQQRRQRRRNGGGGDDDGGSAGLPASSAPTLRALSWHLVHVAMRRADAQDAPGRMASQTAWAYVRLGLSMPLPPSLPHGGERGEGAAAAAAAEAADAAALPPLPSSFPAPASSSSASPEPTACSWAELVSLLGERAADFNALDCANALWALGRVAQLRQRGAAPPPPPLASSSSSSSSSPDAPCAANASRPSLSTEEARALRAVQIRAARTAGRLDPRGVSSVLWSAAVVGECDGRLAEALARRAAGTAERFSPQALSLALWACARLRLYDPRALGALRLRLLNIARDLGPQALANAAWALATLGGGGGIGGGGVGGGGMGDGLGGGGGAAAGANRALLSALVAAALGGGGGGGGDYGRRAAPALRMSPQGLANFCWALARLGWWAGGPAAASAASAALAADAAPPPDALSAAATPDHALLAELTRHAARSVHRTGCQECSNLMWALAALWSRRERWEQQLRQHAGGRGAAVAVGEDAAAADDDGIGGGGVGVGAPVYARCGPDLPAFLRAAGALLEDLEGALGPADIAQVGWALATLRARPAEAGAAAAAAEAGPAPPPSSSASSSLTAAQRAVLVFWREAGRRPHQLSPSELGVVAWSLAATAPPQEPRRREGGQGGGGKHAASRPAAGQQQQQQQQPPCLSPAAVRATARGLGRAAFARLASARFGAALPPSDQGAAASAGASAAAAAAAAPGLAGFCARGLVGLLWALARLRAGDPQLLHACVGSLSLSSSPLPPQDALMLAVAAARTPGFRDDAGGVAALVRASAAKATAAAAVLAAPASPFASGFASRPGAWASLAQAVARLQARERGHCSDPALAAQLADAAAAEAEREAAREAGGGDGGGGRGAAAAAPPQRMSARARGALLLALARLGLSSGRHPRQVDRLLSALMPGREEDDGGVPAKAALAVARGVGSVLAGGPSPPPPGAQQASARAARRALAALERACWRPDAGTWDLPGAGAGAARLHGPLELGLLPALAAAAGAVGAAGSGPAGAGPSPRALARLRDECLKAHLAGRGL